MKRLAAARLWHEGNSFTPVPTTLEDFEAREWTRGAEALAFYRGTATEMGAVAAFAETRPGWQVTFLRCAAANPGGPVAAATVATIQAELLRDLAAGSWDAVYLSLHGAMVAEDDPAPEPALLRAVRAAVGRTPLVATFDLHANLAPAIVDLVDFAAGYKTYPHVDMREVADQALDVACRLADRSVQPCGAVSKPSLVLPSFNMRTTDGPMAELAEAAAQWRRRPGVLDASVFGGFAYGDTPQAGAGAMVWTDGDAALAQAGADALAAALRDRAKRFAVRLPTPAEGLAKALAGPRPAAVLDPADNPLSGGIGDTPALFRAVCEARPPARAVFAFFCDPAAVAAAHAAGVGGALRLTLGGRLSDAFGAGVEVDARVLRLTDGRFVNAGPMERGLAVDLGRTAVMEAGGIELILTSACRPLNDPAYLALHGVDLGDDLLLCVKAKNHFRAAFGGLLKSIVEVDAPGPATADLRRLRYRRLPPGIRLV
jgi:microcystin degradation protein MlrC